VTQSPIRSDHRVRSQARRVRKTCLALAGALLVGGLLTSLPGARAGEFRPGQPLPVAIPPQPVSDALAEFAHQTGLQLIYVSAIARARMSRGAPAGLAPDQALAQILEGTGLSFEFLNARTVRIFEAAVVAPTAQSSVGDTPQRPPEHHTMPGDPRLREVLVMGSKDAQLSSTVDEAQNVGAAVSILTGDTLAARKLEGVTDYAGYVPGLIAASGGSPGQSTVILRGLSPQAEVTAVRYYLDDTPMGASGTNGSTWGFPLDLLPYDLERIEVLRGPQGTLYGADSGSGLIRYVLKSPNVEAFEARAGMDVSAISGASVPGASLRAMLNAPLADQSVGLRASVYDNYTPGFINNAYTGARDVNTVRQYGGRIGALWVPLASLTVKVNALWHRIQSDSNAIESFPAVAVAPNTGDVFELAPAASAGAFTESHAFESPFTKSIDYYSATLNWNPDQIGVVSASAWSHSRTHQVRDDSRVYGGNFSLQTGGVIPTGLVRLDRYLDLEKLTQEVRVSSSGGGYLEWLLGAFYTHENAKDLQTESAFDTAYHPIAAFAPDYLLTSLPTTFTQWAAFADLTWRPGKRIDLTVGVRRAHDDQSGLAITGGPASNSLPATPTSPPCCAVPTIAAPRQIAEGVTTWMAAARYHPTPQMLLYGRVATGFEPGLSNGAAAGVPPTVKAETLTNYEIGVKTQLPEHSTVVDLSAYYVAWNDVQIDVFNGFYANVGNVATVGGATAVAKGAELATTYAPVPGFNLGFNAAYSPSYFTKSPPAAPYLLTGYQLYNVPKWSASFTADYDWPITNLARAHVGGGLRWAAWTWAIPVQSFSQGGGPTFKVPSSAVLDVNAAITRGRFAVRAFARNLSNKHTYQNGSDVFDTAVFRFVQIDHVVVQPRTIGIGVEYAF
jgi:iron complex outermembrane receptor protein